MTDMQVFRATHGFIIPGGDIDSRTRSNGHDEELDRLANSIKRRGLLQPIIGRRIGLSGKIQIIAGNRRHEAIGLLIESGDWPADKHINVLLRDVDDATAFEDSIAENVERRKLGALEEYEAFAKAKANGASIADLAARFGETETVIRQRLALGELHPEIRQAWMDQEIDWDAATVFCMVPDQEAQAALYRRLKAAGTVRSFNVKNALSAGRAAAAFGLITPEAYVARGGTITEDLFGNDHIVSDPDLAATMAGEVLQAECERLKADGWSWARLRSEVNNHWNYGSLQIEGALNMDELAEVDRLENFIIATGARAQVDDDDTTEEEDDLIQDAQDEIDAIHAKARERGSWTAEQKAASGCFVGQEGGRDGSLKIEYGCVDPASTKPKVNVEAHARSAPGKSEAPEPEARPTIPDTLATALSEQRTAAVALNLRSNPHVALAAATLALEAPFSDGPVKLSSRGINEAYDHSIRGEGYAKALAGLAALPPRALLDRFTVAVGAAMDMRVLSEKHTKNVTFDAFLTQIGDPKGYEEIAREKFNPGLFFDLVNGAIRQAAWAEMHPDLKANPFPKGKKGEIVVACLAAQKATGWLPPQLRFPVAED